MIKSKKSDGRKSQFHHLQSSISTLPLLVLTMAALVPSTAYAADDSGKLDEIVVTAQKRAQNLQDVGVSITALSGDSLAKLGRQDITAIVNQVPSMQVQQYSPSITVFNLRGVAQNDFSDYQEAPIAFYNDEVYIGALGAISGQTFDLQRVEVLRGPQGTLFGRNATGGLVQVVTAKPTKTLQGFLTLTGGSYGQFATEGAISGPITDHVRARLSFTTDNYGGYHKNLIGPALANQNFFAVRGQVETDVGDTGKLLAKVELLHNRQRGSGYTSDAAAPNADGVGALVGPRSPDPLTGSFNEVGAFDRTYWNTLVRYDQDFGFGQFTSLTSYQHLKKHYVEDGDGGPFPLFRIESNQRLYEVSQEFRLAGKSDKFNWLIGVYGMKIHQTVDAPAVLFGFPVGDYGSLDTQSIAGFGQGEYKFNNVFSLILGGRYSSDRKKFDYSIPFQFFTFNNTLYPGLARKTFNNFSYKAEIDAKLSKNVLLYVSVNRGTKSGGFTAPVILSSPSAAFQIPFDQEVLTNTEGGFKITLLDRKLTLNGSAFHYHYKNYQSFAYVGVSELIFNKPAEINGFELEFKARPVKGLTLNGFATHLFTADVYNVTLPFGTTVAATRMPQTPEWSLGAGATLDIPLQNVGDLTLATNWKYDTHQYFSTFNAPVDYEKARIAGDVRVTFKPENAPFEAAFFVNNVTDKRYRVYGIDTSALLGTNNSVYAKPRWFGGSLTYRLN